MASEAKEDRTTCSAKSQLAESSTRHSSHPTKSRCSSPERPKSRRRRKPRRLPSISTFGTRKRQPPECHSRRSETRTSCPFRATKTCIISTPPREATSQLQCKSPSPEYSSHVSQGLRISTSSSIRRRRCSWLSCHTTRSKMKSLNSTSKRTERPMLSRIQVSIWKKIMRSSSSLSRRTMKTLATRWKKLTKPCTKERHARLKLSTSMHKSKTSPPKLTRISTCLTLWKVTRSSCIESLKRRTTCGLRSRRGSRRKNCNRSRRTGLKPGR